MTEYEKIGVTRERYQTALRLFDMGYETNLLAKAMDEPEGEFIAWLTDLKLSGDPVEKYTLIQTNETYFYNDEEIPLYKIQAVRNIRDKDGLIVVKKWDFGGLTDSKQTLSHVGFCWIGEDAIVVRSTVEDHVGHPWWLTLDYPALPKFRTGAI